MSDKRGLDFQIMMTDKEFDETHDVSGAMDAAIRYFNFLVPVNRDGSTPVELLGSLPAHIGEFIKKNKEKRFSKVAEIDSDFFTAMTLQRIMNEHLLYTNKALEKRLEFLHNLKIPAEKSPLRGGNTSRNKPSSGPISIKLNDIVTIIRLMAFLRGLEENDYSLTFVGMYLTVTQSLDGMDRNPIELQFFDNRKYQPVKVATTLCTLTLVGKRIYVKFSTQFRKDLFYRVLHKADLTEYLAEFM